MKDFEKYMRRCLELAREAKARGKTAVGSLIVREGEILGEGIEGDKELPALMSHAEALAILHAQKKTGTKDLKDCEIFTTVEPCFFCSYLIRQTKIKRVIYGTETPMGGHSSPYPILIAKDLTKWGQPPEVISGILKEKCEALLKPTSNT